MYKPEQLPMRQLLHRDSYAHCGIEVAWNRSSLCADHPRVIASDDYSRLLFDLVSNLVVELARRGLPMTHGYPKQQVLLLDPDPATQARFIDQLREDYRLYCKVRDDAPFQGSEAFAKRSPFNK
eukprot:3179281-Pyramimonas_sp.AAC.1